MAVYGGRAGGLTPLPPPLWLHHSPLLVSGDIEAAMLSAENSGKSLGGRGCAQTPLLTAFPQTPSWWGGGCRPFPKKPTPLSAFGLGSPMNNPDETFVHPHTAVKLARSWNKYYTLSTQQI